MNSLYETDFYAWTAAQAQALKQKNINEIDWEDLIEEIETLGRSEKREVTNYLVVTLLHKIKLNYGFIQDCERGWKVSLLNGILGYNDGIDDNPSLKGQQEEILKKAYKKAFRQFYDEATFISLPVPDVCPWSLDEILNSFKNK